jgi:hypothetical protein
LLRLQRLAGNQAVAGFVQRQAVTTTDQPPAPNARFVLATQLPAVLAQLDDAQIAQTQKLLDTSGDPQAYTHAEREFRIRLDEARLLSDDALKPKVFAESGWAEQARARIADRGIWLRMNLLPTTPAWKPEAWLSLGRDTGDSIAAPFGFVTRDALLGTWLGPLHYHLVNENPLRKQFEALHERTGAEVRGGQEENFDQARVRREALIGVPQISDALGHAEFPDPADWELPWSLHMDAAWALVRNEVEVAYPLILVSSLLAALYAKRLAVYQERTAHGAAIAAKWARRVMIAAEIAGTVLGLGGAIQGFMAASGELAAGEAFLAALRSGKYEVDAVLAGEGEGLAETVELIETQAREIKQKGSKVLIGYSGGS